MSKIEGKYAPQWPKVRRFGSVRTCSPENFWSPNLNLNSNRTLRSVWKVQVQTEVLDRTSATLGVHIELLIVELGQHWCQIYQMQTECEFRLPPQKSPRGYRNGDLHKGPSGFECQARGLGGGWVFDGLKRFTKVGKNSIFSMLWQWADLLSSSR